MANEIINVEKLLPEKLRDKPLLSKLARLLDYIIENFYQNDYKGVKEAYNVFTNYEIICKVLADEKLKDYLQLTGQEEAELVWLLNLTQRLRGTKRGLKFFLRLIGLENAIVTDRAEDPSLDPCNVSIDVGAGTVFDASQVLLILNQFLHICMEKEVEIASAMEFEYSMIMGASAGLTIYL